MDKLNLKNLFKTVSYKVSPFSSESKINEEVFDELLSIYQDYFENRKDLISDIENTGTVLFFDDYIRYRRNVRVDPDDYVYTSYGFSSNIYKVIAISSDPDEFKRQVKKFVKSKNKLSGILLSRL